MLTVHALARSDLVLSQGGEWRLHSRFSQAINLVDPDGKLLTLHRFGKGCSPAGWLFRSDDFDLLNQWLTPASTLRVEGDFLVSEGLQIGARRKLNLSIPHYDTLTIPNLRFCSAPTGLLGSLNEACENMEHPLLRQLHDGLTRWSAGEEPDWRMIIGLGPGLTPSGDDMLIGAMAVVYSHAHFRNALKKDTFLPPDSQLVALTTSVSCTYLENAREGRFSTPLLRLLRRLATHRDSRSAVESLLAHGHTSGADTIIGLVTALRWLEGIQQG